MKVSPRKWFYLIKHDFTEDCVVLINAQVVRKDFPYLNGFA